MCIGAFLFATSLNHKRQAAPRIVLASVTVRQVMVHRAVTLSPDISVQEAVDQYFVAQGYGEFPVCEEGQVVGVVTVRDVQALPTALWPWRRVREMMRPTSPALCIPPDWSIMQAMDRMAQAGLDCLVVMENGEIVGLVTRSAIAQYVQLHKV
jgi:CBS domain-containing protein